ncbi:P63C domain-containing protein [aff. Roholtiella sp. LEGE 12411]|uniref:P63C domain-containing protein n=1 Tax=aff. Roholtiella sp. LEGE 12411 TaxID=1828822 RepID=UPI00187EF203|nr:P63C domain-containing protein [aff. Roholtiella sp. LEGE 12411]MBE9038701.1 hypothetical protein [aff. Roholtiella sp. LEGE 12411]
MAKKKSNLEARHTLINIGNIVIDGYEMLPEGSGDYICAKVQVSSILDINHRRFAQLIRLNLAKILMPEGLQVRAISTLTAQIDGIMLEQVTKLWALAASRGNEKAAILLAACGTETLERRFDRAFNKQVSEKERDDKLTSRILNAPQPWTRMFEAEFESHLARITKLHKKNIRNGLYYWEFIYSWMTPEEKAKLDVVNPALPNGRRKHKIHQMLSDQTKKRLTPHVTSILILMKSANSVPELRRLVQRQYGVDQPNLFDGWQIG